MHELLSFHLSKHSALLVMIYIYRDYFQCSVFGAQFNSNFSNSLSFGSELSRYHVFALSTMDIKIDTHIHSLSKTHNATLFRRIVSIVQFKRKQKSSSSRSDETFVPVCHSDCMFFSAVFRFVCSFVHSFVIVVCQVFFLLTR